MSDQQYPHADSDDEVPPALAGTPIPYPSQTPSSCFVPPVVYTDLVSNAPTPLV